MVFCQFTLDEVEEFFGEGISEVVMIFLIVELKNSFGSGSIKI